MLHGSAEAQPIADDVKDVPTALESSETEVEAVNQPRA